MRAVALLLVAAAAAALLLPRAAVEAALVSNGTLGGQACGDSVLKAGSYCWVASSTFPVRVCVCMLNACPSATISETQTCFICDRGAFGGQGRPTTRTRPGAARCGGMPSSTAAAVRPVDV